MILTHADQPAGHLPDISFTCREKSEMRATKTRSNSEGLRLPDDNIGSTLFGCVLSGRFQNAE